MKKYILCLIIAAAAGRRSGTEKALYGAPETGSFKEPGMG
jgi:hypothetical protein